MKKTPFTAIALAAVALLSSCGSDATTNPPTNTIALDTNTYGYPWKSGMSFAALQDARDGQVYRTVTIGNQTWMAQNLNYKVDSSKCYQDSARNCLVFGRLYQWAAAMGLPAAINNSVWGGSGSVQGACPSGWHLPDSAEWRTLVSKVGGSAIAGTRLKSTLGWPGTTNGSDSVGFRVLPAGCYAGGFRFGYGFALFWTSTQVSSTMSVRTYFGDYSDSRKTDDYKTSLFSVRCVKD